MLCSLRYLLFNCFSSCLFVLFVANSFCILTTKRRRPRQVGCERANLFDLLSGGRLQ
jgi:hypothetical protein